MDSTRARDHLEAVATILRAADRSLNLPPWIFVIWGLFGTLVNALHQARESGLTVPGDGSVQPPLLLLAIAVTVWLSVRGGHGRETATDGHAGVVFSVVFAVLIVANAAAQHRVMSYQAMALFWSFGFAIALLIVGLEASRPLLLGGLALVAASVAACLVPGWFSGLLSAGWLAGMVAPGLALAWRGRDGRAAAV